MIKALIRFIEWPRSPQVIVFLAMCPILYMLYKTHSLPAAGWFAFGFNAAALFLNELLVRQYRQINYWRDETFKLLEARVKTGMKLADVLGSALKASFKNPQDN